MPNAYYTCNLLPLELVARAGYSPRWLGEHLQDPGAPARRDALSIHPMTCPYVARLVAAADALFDDSAEGDVLLVPGGCDAMRRLGDLLDATYPGRVFTLSLGRSSGDHAVETLAGDLARLERWLNRLLKNDVSPSGCDGYVREKDAGSTNSGAICATEDVLSGRLVRSGGRGFALQQPLKEQAAGVGGEGAAGAKTGAIIKETPQVDYPTPPRPGGVFVVAGPLTDNSLLRLIAQLGAFVSGLESCTSPDRWKPLTAAGGGDAGASGTAAGASPYNPLAREMLALGMCPRRSTAERRDHLARRLDESEPSSVIYARQSFCDPGAYDAVLTAELAEERGLPFLEIEVGFPFEAGGPLHTRVEAFLEAQLLDDDLLDDLLDLDE